MSSKELSLIAKLIIEDKNLFNGHSQITISSMLSFEELQPLMKELESFYPDKLKAIFWPDGSGGLEAENHWAKGEHPEGHRHKMLFSWGG